MDLHGALARTADLVLSRPPRLGTLRLVAVDGPSGSGKTTTAAALAEEIAGRCGGRVVRPARTANEHDGQDQVEGPDLEGQGQLGGWGRFSTPHQHGYQQPKPTSVGPTPKPAGPTSLSAGWKPAGPTPPPGGPTAPSPGPTSLSAGWKPARPTPPSAGPTVAVCSTDLLATWDEPLGWWPILEEHLLAPLAAGREARLPVVQWVSGHPRPGGNVLVPVVDVLVLEGVSSGRAEVAGRLSALVWVEVPGVAVRLARAVARDGESMRPFLARWQVQEAEHFAADGTRDRADVIIRPGAG